MKIKTAFWFLTPITLAAAGIAYYLLHDSLTLFETAEDARMIEECVEVFERRVISKPSVKYVGTVFERGEPEYKGYDEFVAAGVFFQVENRFGAIVEATTVCSFIRDEDGVLRVFAAEVYSGGSVPADIVDVNGAYHVRAEGVTFFQCREDDTNMAIPCTPNQMR